MKNLKYIFICLILFHSMTAFAVPMTFTKSGSGNMHDVNWVLLQSENIQVYTDEKSQEMGRYALTSVQDAYPYLSLLLGVKIGENDINKNSFKDYIFSNYPSIVLILGDRVEGAGFANPVTQNIEAQMIHPRNASFFQHELVHRLMYEHNDFHIGSMGRLFSLGMMPTWWLEGLAEHLTESLGLLKIQGLDRTMSLENNWPTWERLHALYNATGDENLRGYSTSGRFLRWILSQVPNKSLYKIHEEIANDTITPFFYDASDNWLKRNIHKTGFELYKVFKQKEKKFWTNYINNMPSITESSVAPPFIAETSYRPIYTDFTKVLDSHMNNKDVVRTSSFIVYTGQTREKKQNLVRRPLYSIEGSRIFAVDTEKKDNFLTTKWIPFSNSSFGSELELIQYKGDIFSLTDDNILRTIKIPFATIENPYVVEEIKSAGQGGYFIHASLRGNSFVFFYNKEKNSLKKIVEMKFPVFPKFLDNGNYKYSDHKENQNCIFSIVSWDKERTSLSRICEKSPLKEIIPQGKYFIQDGLVLNNETFRLLISWDKLLALADINKNEFTPIAAFPEWTLGLYGSSSSPNIFYSWVYSKSQYKLMAFDVNKLRTRFQDWQLILNADSPFYKYSPRAPYEAPYKKEYDKVMVAKPKNILLANADTQIKPKPKIRSQISSTNPAPYDHNLLFAFPYALPTAFGGPSVNLITFPYVDKMERDVIQVFAGYHFYLKAPNGTITYINNRILDGFAISAFATPYFNGVYNGYDNNGVYGKYYNYLFQEGMSLANSLDFKPYSLRINQLISFSHLKPYSVLHTAPSSIGTQNANLLSITESLSYNVFQTGLYMEDAEKPGGHYLYWKTDMTLGGGKFNTLGPSTDSQNYYTGRSDYWNFNSGLTTSFIYHKHSLTFSGKVSTTQGLNSFNLKEFDSPYQSYILGSTKSLSYVSYPMYASDSLFDIQMGYWSQQTTVQYNFPIFPKAETLFLMSYIDNWRGFVSFQDDGVSVYKNATSFNNVQSVSIGTHLNVDIKGYTLEPSFSYTQLLSQSGWGVILQIKFMDLFRY